MVGFDEQAMPSLQRDHADQGLIVAVAEGSGLAAEAVAAGAAALEESTAHTIV